MECTICLRPVHSGDRHLWLEISGTFTPIQITQVDLPSPRGTRRVHEKRGVLPERRTIGSERLRDRGRFREVKSQITLTFGAIGYDLRLVPGWTTVIIPPPISSTPRFVICAVFTHGDRSAAQKCANGCYGMSIDDLVRFVILGAFSPVRKTREPANEERRLPSVAKGDWTPAGPLGHTHTHTHACAE